MGNNSLRSKDLHNLSEKSMSQFLLMSEHTSPWEFQLSHDDTSVRDMRVSCEPECITSITRGCS